MEKRQRRKEDGLRVVQEMAGRNGDGVSGCNDDMEGGLKFVVLRQSLPPRLPDDPVMFASAVGDATAARNCTVAR